MSKFKVGDRARVVANTCRHDQKINNVITLEGMGRRCAPKENQPAWGIVGSIYYISERDIEHITDDKILITTDGKTTTARLYNGKKVIKSAEATCAPSDTFDFKAGAKIAFDRLIGREKPQDKPAEPVKLYYAVKDYNGGRCIKGGTVYETDKDGHITYSNGLRSVCPANTYPDGALKGILYPLIKRPAKVGEWVYIINASIDFSNTYKNGDILKIIDVDECGPRYGEVCGQYLEKNEYLVLDGYNPEQPKDNTEERVRLKNEVCRMGACRAACSRRTNDCPLKDISGYENCSYYVHNHPETQKIMEDYLAAERAPAQRPDCAKCANWRAK